MKFLLVNSYFGNSLIAMHTWYCRGTLESCAPRSVPLNLVDVLIALTLNNLKKCNFPIIKVSQMRLLSVFPFSGVHPYCLHSVQPRNESSSLETDVRDCGLWLNSRFWNYTEKGSKIKPYTIFRKIWSDKRRCKQGKHEEKLKYLMGWFSGGCRFCFAVVYIVQITMVSGRR